jgi:hypothetical protein
MPRNPSAPGLCSYRAFVRCRDLAYGEDGKQRRAWWLPPFGQASGLYRGFDLGKLHTVLETGLDVPPQSPFFATYYADKAWEYPVGRAFAAMLVLDREMAERSFVTTALGADPTSTTDGPTYPNEYTDGATRILTRFDVGRGTRTFLDEDMYGHWIPEMRVQRFAALCSGPTVVDPSASSGVAGEYRRRCRRHRRGSELSNIGGLSACWQAR